MAMLQGNRRERGLQGYAHAMTMGDGAPRGIRTHNIWILSPTRLPIAAEARMRWAVQPNATMLN